MNGSAQRVTAPPSELRWRLAAKRSFVASDRRPYAAGPRRVSAIPGKSPGESSTKWRECFMQLNRSLRIAAAGVASVASVFGASAAQAVSFSDGSVIATLGNFRTAANPNPPTYELDMNLGPSTGIPSPQSFTLPAQAGTDLVGQTFALYAVPNPSMQASILIFGSGPVLVDQ